MNNSTCATECSKLNEYYSAVILKYIEEDKTSFLWTLVDVTDKGVKYWKNRLDSTSSFTLDEITLISGLIPIHTAHKDFGLLTLLQEVQMIAMKESQ